MASKRRAFAVLAALAALAVPATALGSGGPPLGSGGGGGGGGGGGSTTPPPPVVNPVPCATALETTGGRLIWTAGANMNLSYNVTNCSASDETVAVSFTETGISSSDTLQSAPCSNSASWSAGPFTIKPGSTQGFSTFVPQLTCPFINEQDHVQGVFSDAASGTTLATTSTFAQRISANGPAIRGGLP